MRLTAGDSPHSTCECRESRQAQSVGQSSQLHGVQLWSGGQAVCVQVLQHRLHAHAAGVREHHLNTQDWMNRIVLAHNRLLFTDTDILFDAWQIKDDF